MLVKRNKNDKEEKNGKIRCLVLDLLRANLNASLQRLGSIVRNLDSAGEDSFV